MLAAQAMASPSCSGSPLKSVVTPAPSFSTRPTASWPRITGVGIGRFPWWRCTSVPQTPPISTLATSAPGSGSRTGASSSISGSLKARRTAPRAMVTKECSFIAITRHVPVPASTTTDREWLGALAEVLRARAHKRAGDLVIDLQPDPRFVGQHDVAILDHRLILQGQILPPGIVDPVPLHDQKVRDRGADVGRGHGAERPADIVRGERHIVDLRHVRDLAALRESTALGDVRHDVVNRLLLQQVAEAPAQVEILPRAERHRRDALDLPHGRYVFRRNWLLQPEQSERLHRSRHCDPTADVVPTMHVDGEVDGRSDRFPYRRDPLDHPIEFGIGGVPVPAVSAKAGPRLVDVELERVKAEGDDLLCPLSVGRGREVLARVAVAVEADCVPELAAEELIDRQAERLPGKIPEGDLDPGHRRDRCPRHCPVEELGPSHLLEKHVDVERALAKDGVLQRVDHLRTAFATVDALPVADDTLVGEDADVGRVAVPLDLRGADIGDLHLETSSLLGSIGGTVRPVSAVYSAAFSGLGG